MAIAQSPQLGYNTNVRYKTRVFHVQTEDSGVTKPHVISHLFADGGRIIKSVKKAYADQLEAPDLIARVKKLMQEQHKAMLLALRAGEFDALIGFDPEPEAVLPSEAVAREAIPDAMVPDVGAREVIPDNLAAIHYEPPLDDGGRSTMPDGIPLAAIAQASRGVTVTGPVVPATNPALRSPWVVRSAGSDPGYARSLDEVILALLADELAAGR